MAIAILEAALWVGVGQERQIIRGGVGIQVDKGVHDQEGKCRLASPLEQMNVKQKDIATYPGQNKAAEKCESVRTYGVQLCLILVDSQILHRVVQVGPLHGLGKLSEHLDLSLLQLISQNSCTETISEAEPLQRSNLRDPGYVRGVTYYVPAWSRRRRSSRGPSIFSPTPNSTG